MTSDSRERSTIDETGVELAVRKGDGLEVTLVWGRASGRVWVDVVHVFTGESLRIQADPGKALDVYEHPFAHCLDAPQADAVWIGDEVALP